MAKVEKVTNGKPVPIPVEGGREVGYEDSKLGAGFMAMVHRRQKADAAIKVATKEKEELSAKMLALLAKAKIAKVTGLEGWQVIRAKGTTAAKLEKDKLLQYIDAEQLESCTTPGRPYEYVQVREEKEADSDHED